MAAAVLVCAAGGATSSCGGQKKSGTAGAENSETAGGTNAANDGALGETPYMMPEVPQMITDPDARAEWAVEHYWDGFDFADTTLVGSRANYTEQAFADFINQILMRVPREMGDRSIAVAFEKARADKAMFAHLAEVAEKYLFDANSPYRDDETYISVLNAVLANPALDQWERVRPQEQLRMSLKNRVGERAADFRYTLASGASGSLGGLRAKYTLLFFNNPGCPACAQTMEQLMASQFLMEMVADGSLAILAVYPDADLEAWREHAADFPADWINSYDKTLTLKDDELYDLKAIPTMYLLDRSKTVMLKDVMSIGLIEQTIYNQTQTPATAE